ncbi:putative Transposon Tf2-9 polyprotein [Nannochloris sp. 'desiccata']|nr:putative Transposon Tf2-9 polyprotein [Chlorella desiccata (nom. nud.)]
MLDSQFLQELYVSELANEREDSAAVAGTGDAGTAAGMLDERIERLLKKYSTVFPSTLPGVPPERAIVHEIKLVKGAAPVHRAPYRLSVSQENELRLRLKELMELGLIRPSKSPWAAPILFVPKKDGTLRFCVDYRGLNKITIAVSERDREKTAFTTVFGLFEFVVMPFGLTNAPATFSRLMMDVFKDFLYDFVLVYLDDILIFSENEEEHNKHLKLVLDKLAEHQLVAKLSKCSFFKSEVEYLGFVVSADGVKMAEDKIQAVLEWPKPQDVRDVRGFLGLTGFYRHFIRNYAHIAAPLNELTKQGVPFIWTPLHEGHFNELKKAITSSPVLQVYNPAAECVVCTDASNIAVGAVLLQASADGPAAELKPVAFFSKKLRGAELNYDARTREFLAIKMVAAKWKHYLNNGKTLIFYTDHESLQYLNSQTDLSPKFIRWYGNITSWLGGPPIIRYKPGKENVVADALSRRPDHALCALSLVMPADELYVPDVGDLRELLIHEMHDLPLVGHQGINRTLKRLIEQFGWPYMGRDVAEYVRSCRFDAIMVVVDRFSKYVEFIPTYTSATAEDTAMALFYNHILCRHGCPSSIVSDRDSKFISSFWQSRWSSVGTRLKLSTSYHPQTDGQTERANRVLEEMLRSFCLLEPERWVAFLPQARFAVNTAVNISTTMSPFSIVYGRNPRMPASYVAGNSDAVPVSVERFRQRHVLRSKTYLSS